MNITSKLNPTFGLALFFVGILLGTLLAGGLIWANIEAPFYGLPHLTSDTFDGLNCPPLMTHSETANLTVTVHNDTDRLISPLIRVEISTPGLSSSSRENTPDIPPGESATLEWPLSKENIDLNFFIFAKAFRYPTYKTRLAEATCGILVLNVPFLTGSALLGLWLGASILCVLTGLWILGRHYTDSRRSHILTGLRLMAGVMLVGVLLGIQGAWVPGVAILVVIILLAAGLLYFSII